MSRDVRELILARLLKICEGIDGVAAAYRNKDEISEDKRPAIQIFDAAETTNLGDAYVPKPARGPNLVMMTPELVVLLGAEPKNVGSDINALRMKVLKAVMDDATLKSLVGSNGMVRYDGCETGLMHGRSMEGDMSLSFSFVYPLLPQDL